MLFNNFKNGDTWGAAKSGIKAVGDLIMIGVKASPVGLLLSVGWAVVSTFW